MSLLRATRCVPFLQRIAIHRAFVSTASSPAFPHESAIDSSTSSGGHVTDANVPSTHEARTPNPSRRKRTSTPKSRDEDIGPSVSTSKSELYIQSLSLGGLEPQLADLERLKPREVASTKSPTYADKYHALADMLCRAFSSSQLRGFYQEYGLKPKKVSYHKMRKMEFAEGIMGQVWEWPSPREMERRKKENTEVVAKSFLIEPSHLFVIMGRDGMDLLALSKSHNVHASVTRGPLALRVEGVSESIIRVEEYIENIRKNIVQEVFELPSKAPIPPNLVQRISRMAGAFIENVSSEGTVRICARDVADMQRAQRLTMRVAATTSPPRLFAHRSPESDSSVGLPTADPISYAFYPFLSPRPLPWTMSPGVSRWRRVGDWLGLDRREGRKHGLHATEGAISAISGEDTWLRTRATEYFPGIPQDGGYQRRTITATPGHLVFPFVEPGSNGNLPTSFKGTAHYHKVLRYLSRRYTTPTFLPSLPPEILEARPAPPELIHRLVYRALLPPEHAKTRDNSLYARASKFIRFDVGVFQDEPGLSPVGSDIEDLNPHYSMQCIHGWSMDVDVLMPDRHMDLRLTTTDSGFLKYMWQPSELRQYYHDLQRFMISEEADAEQPRPPVQLHTQGRTYLLIESASVQRSHDTLPLPDLEVVTERVLDLESSQKYATTQIRCEDYSSKTGWMKFYEQCDRLTGESYASQRQPSNLYGL